MFGVIVDILLNSSKPKDKKLSKKIKQYNFRDKDSGTYWVCFYPEIVEKWDFLKKRLISCHSNADIYILPEAEAIIQPDPKLTRNYLDKVIRNATRKHKFIKTPNQKLNVIGVSLGNVLAFKYASLFKVDNLISVIPGSKLPECIWESITTKEIAENSGKKLRDYKEELSFFNPIDDLERTKTKFCEMHIGTSDKMIPYKRGLQLAQKAEKKIPGMDLKVYRACGHVETILRFARKFPKRFK